MSRNRKVCQNCRSKVIVTPTLPPQNVFKDFSQIKQVISKRVDVFYTKKVSMDGETRKYAVTYSNLWVNKQFKTLKEQEKYKKKFKNSLKSNKNKWQVTNNGIESKVLISKHRLKRRSDILKKHYISEKEMEFLVDQVTSEKRCNLLKDDIFINHSFNEEHFFELRKNKEASFKRNDSKAAEQSSSAGQGTMINNIITNLQEMEISGQDNVAPWQEILGKQEPIIRVEFHRELNSIRDKRLLMTCCNSVRRGRHARGVTHDNVVN
ncbi:hypothetical protein RhiirA5_458697 [Rhizophagus irregularis]|uniref:Uncharacterized protein n=1 Tax=Rhizophagus irregularis TaxID=588596 RepID=A0A2N0NQ44_9GLOM|nr:hypothetical protein RhiirA5_434416 [Rhizophagus irregularis]PKC00554.1 hypothetical protein RhiirA5_458697 [Rhizophagus irregularis]CAB5180863.1 unnamed protein product [Rhizophagus irregularis]